MRTKNKIVSTVIAGSLFVPALLGTTAFAQVDNAIDRTDIASIIDSDRTEANLTINKYLDNTPGAPGNGAPAPADQLDGTAYEAQFTIYRIGNLDPKSLDGWTTYSNLDFNNYDASANTLDGQALTQVAQVTTTGGTSTSTLPLGFYFVVETPEQGVSTVTPFAVALPMGNAQGNGWNYDVQVYPKNQQFNVTKAVSDSFKNAGDIIQYTLTGDTVRIPQGQTGLTRYTMVDRQPADIVVNPASTAINIRYNTPTAQDQTVALEAADFTSAVNPNRVGDTIISLTSSGLAKLSDVVRDTTNSNVQVVATVDATVNGTPESLFPETTGESIKEINTVYLYSENGLGDPLNPTDEDIQDSVESRFGTVRINKTGSDTDAALPGAVFELYRCEPSTGADANNEPQTIAGPLTVNGQNTWTTGADGSFTITGLQVDDYRNGGDAAADPTNTQDTFDYCVVETQAPEGYQLLPDPVALDVSDANPVASANIANIPNNGGFDLPFTGENGAYMIYVLAGLLGSVGVIYLIASSRRKEEV